MATEAKTRLRPGLVVAGVLLTGFGYLAIFSIGAPILVAGVFVLVAGLSDVHRQRPRVFWPFAAGVAAFFVGYILVAPLSCTSEAVVVEAVDDAPRQDSAGATECSNLLGIDYSGGPGYDPPLWAGGLAGATGAVGVGTATRWLMTGRRRVSA